MELLQVYLQVALQTYTVYIITGLIKSSSTHRCCLHGTITGVTISSSFSKYCPHGSITVKITRTLYYTGTTIVALLTDTVYMELLQV